MSSYIEIEHCERCNQMTNTEHLDDFYGRHQYALRCQKCGYTRPEDQFVDANKKISNLDEIIHSIPDSFESPVERELPETRHTEEKHQTGWEKSLIEGLRYRIAQEESKYNNKPSRQVGVDWIQMIIDKIVPDIVEEVNDMLAAKDTEITNLKNKLELMTFSVTGQTLEETIGIASQELDVSLKINGQQTNKTRIKAGDKISVFFDKLDDHSKDLL